MASRSIANNGILRLEDKALVSAALQAILCIVPSTKDFYCLNKSTVAY